MSRVISVLLLLLPAIGFTQYHLYVQNGGTITVQSNAMLTIAGGVKAAGSSSLLLNGSLFLTKDNTTQQALWTDSTGSGFINANSSGTVHFQTNQPLLFSGNTVFPTAYIESDSSLFLQNNLVVRNKLHLTRGIITTNNNYVIIQSTNLQALEADASNANFSKSWIAGNVRRYFNATVPAYAFALGRNAGNNLVLINNNNNPLTGINYIDVTFEPKTDPSLPVNIVEGDEKYTRVLTAGIWKVQSDQPISGGTFDLKVFFEGFPSLADNNFTIVNRSVNANSDQDWIVPPGSFIEPLNGTGRKVNDSFALRHNINTLGQFAIAVTNSSLLPIKLLYFNAVYTGNVAALKWKTTSEQNSKSFAVQRSSNGISFSNIGSVNATGNSTIIHDYIFTDEQPLSGTSYYRLQMIDIDGQFAYSNIATVKTDMSNKVMLYPNPVHDILQVHIPYTTNEKLVLEIRDNTGKRIQQKTVVANGNTYPIRVSSLANGVYYLIIKKANSTEVYQFIKE